MALKNHSLLLLAIITIFNCVGTESRGLYQSGGNSELAVDAINSRLQSDLLKIDGDLIRINPENFKSVILDSVRAAIANKLQQNPALAALLEKGVKEQLNSQSSQIDEVIEKNPVSLDVVRQYLDNPRSKRSLQTRDFDLGSLISDIVANVLHEQLSSVVWGILENSKAVILQLKTASEPTNDLERVLAYAVNTIVQKLLELITSIQQSIKTQVAAETTTASGTALRKRRAAGDDAAAGGDTAADGSGSGDTDGSSDADNSGGGIGFGLLEGLVRPLLNILGLITTPLNLLLKGLGGLLLGLLSPIIGSTLVSAASAAVNNLLDLLLPSLI